MIDLSTLRPQAHRYFRSCLWLAKDGFFAERRRVVLIIIANLIGITTAASSMGLVLWYLRWAQKPSRIVVRGVEIPLSTEAGSLLLVGLGALLIGLASVLCIFYSELSVQRLSRNYQKVCMTRILRLAGHRGLRQILASAEHAVGQQIAIRDLLVASSRFSAFALRAIVQLFLPVSTLIFAVAFLLVVNWKITLVVAALTVFYFVPMYLINRGVARQHRFYRATIPSVSRTLLQTLRSLMQTSGPIRNSPELWDETLLSTDEFNRLQDALYDRILASRKATFVNGVFLVVCVFALFVVFSLTAGEEGISWTSLLAYVIALRFALRSLQQVAGALTNVSRFFPEFERLEAFMKAGKAAGADPEARASAEVVPAPQISSQGEAEPVFDSPDTEITLARGSRILVLCPRVIDRTLLEQLSFTLLKRRRQAEAVVAAAAFHQAADPIITVTVAGNALGSRQTVEDVKGLEAGLARLGVLEELMKLPQGLETTLMSEQVRALSDEARYAITAAYCFLQPQPYLFLDLDGLRKLTPQFQAAFLAELSRSCVLLVASTMDRLFKPPQKPVRDLIDHAAIALNDNVVRCASMDWLQDRLPEIEKRLTELLSEYTAERGIPEEDDDLDEM